MRWMTWLAAVVVTFATGTALLAQALTPCQEMEARITVGALRLLQGAASNEALRNLDSLLDEAHTCINSSQLTPYQRFSLLYALAYGNYIVGIVSRNAEALYQAQQLFERATTVYDESFDQPEKALFTRYMVAWCELRLFELQGNVNRLNRCIQQLSNPEQFSDLSADARMLLGLALMRRAELSSSQRSQQPNAYEDLRRATEVLSEVRNRGSARMLRSVAALRAVREAFQARLLGVNDQPRHDDLRSLLDYVDDNRDLCGAPGPCLTCLDSLNLQLRDAIREARQQQFLRQSEDQCPGQCEGENLLSGLKALLIGVAPPGGAVRDPWAAFARLLAFWRARMGSQTNDGQVFLPSQLFEGLADAVTNSELRQLVNYGRDLVSLINCSLEAGTEDLPSLDLLHGEILFGVGGNALQQGLMYLALAPLTDGCLYPEASHLFQGVNFPPTAEGQAEKAILRAFAVAWGARSGLQGPNLRAALRILDAVDDTGLDAAHQAELSFSKGMICLALEGWSNRTRNYFDAVDEIDPRAAYFLHRLAPGAPDVERLNAALWQTEYLIERGYGLKWLRERLLAVAGVHPVPSHTLPQLLPDRPPRRWDVLRFDLSEANVTRQLYLDVLEGLTVYAGALLPVPKIPRPWWERQPSNGVQGPREIFLQGEIPVALLLHGVKEHAKVWVFRDGVLVQTLDNYAGEEFQVFSGLRYQFVTSSPGCWPVYVDTFFVEPHQRIDLQISPSYLTSRIRETTGSESAGLSLWRSENCELIYHPMAHIFSFQTGRGNVTIGQQNNQSLIELTKFLGVGSKHLLLDVGNNRVWVCGMKGENGGVRRTVKLTEYQIGRATDFSKWSRGIILADEVGKRLWYWEWDRESKPECLTDVDGNPTSVLCLPRYRDLIWWADAYAGTLWIGRDTRFHRVPGLDFAREDGLSAPSRLIWVPELNYVAVLDYCANRVFFFLPNGEYVGFLQLRVGTGTRFWIGYSGSGSRVLLTVSTVKGIERYVLKRRSDYRFTLSGRYRSSQEVENRPTGGYLVCN